MTASSNLPEPEGATDSSRSAGVDTAWADAGTRRVGVARTHDSKETDRISGTTPVVNPPQAVANTPHTYRAGAPPAAAGPPLPDASFGRPPRTVKEYPQRNDGIHTPLPTSRPTAGGDHHTGGATMVLTRVAGLPTRNASHHRCP
ncbi:hypothetical protein GCM10008995_14550 [Halobellus salinus]|uniref:Uncharacterized protein n=1 Tax=Halobellus salinus TaxID=931585 RepID=A0A830EMN7_9EURY|nr:hypothetical protein GCM10008995_14550 [Halobellus salinus]